MTTSDPRKTIVQPTNAEFAYKDSNFQRWCGVAGVEPTKRQASKFRRKMGQAYKASIGKSGNHRERKG